MITYVSGSLFESPAQVLVNTVNTDGVMGKGVALQFKKIYPEMFREYQALCEAGKLGIGQLHLFKTPHKWVLNFPTKRHWRHPSRVEYIEAGLRAFVSGYAQAGIHSIAFPPLGCGNGQLDYRTQVGPLMTRHLAKLPIDIFIYRGMRTHEAPEHMAIEQITAWLRSEPQSLAFEEVWRDLSEAVQRNPRFATTTGSAFSATVEQGASAGLAVAVSDKVYRFQLEDLLEFWQRLRQFGFTYRRITPEHQKFSYLMPVFERLPYVRRVEVSPTDEGLENNAAVALQVRPMPRQPARVSGDLFSTSE